MPKLQLLHVNFYAYVRQIVFLFLELKNGILNFCLRLVELLEKTLHILSWEPAEVIDLKIYNLSNVSDQLNAIFGVTFNMVVHLWSLFLHKFELIFKCFQYIYTECKRHIFLIGLSKKSLIKFLWLLLLQNHIIEFPLAQKFVFLLTEINHLEFWFEIKERIDNIPNMSRHIWLLWFSFSFRYNYWTFNFRYIQLVYLLCRSSFGLVWITEGDF